MSNIKKTLVIVPSFVLAAVVFGTQLTNTDLQAASFFAYVAWSWYWGLALAWPVYAKVAKYEGKAIDAAIMKLWLPIFWLPFYLCGSMLVGVLGGGIYQFIRFVRSRSEGTSHTDLEQSSQPDK